MRNRSDVILSVILLVLVSSLYYATAAGITSSNDGSHYALLRTMAENRAFTLNQFDDYAEGNDIALTPDGRLFSDRPPGTALLALPFYALGDIIPTQPLPSRHDAENPRLTAVLLLPVLAGAAVVFLLYWLWRGWGIAQPAAFLAALFFAFGTIHWKYSAVFFSHAPSALLILLSLLIAFSLTAQTPFLRRKAFSLGFLLGLAVLVEYSNALLVVVVGLFVLMRLRPKRPFLRFLPFFIMGGALPALFLAYYNTVNFGSPLTVSYAYAVNYPWAGQFSTTFSFPLGAGLKALLYYGESGGWCGGTCYNQGLFLLSQIWLAALPGFYWYGRRAPHAAGLTTAVFLIYLLLFAQHHTAHGFTGDGRYLMPFLPLLALPLGFTVDGVWAWRERPLGQMVAFFILFALFFVSVGNMIVHIGTAYNYHLNLALLDPLIASPQNYRYVADNLFRNGRNLPFLWLVEGLVLLGGLLIARARARGMFAIR